MYHGPPPGFARSVTWRSILVGYAMMVGVFLLMVAASYPRISVAVTASGIGVYVLFRLVETGTAHARHQVPKLSRRLHRAPRPKER